MKWLDEMADFWTRYDDDDAYQSGKQAVLEVGDSPAELKALTV